MRFPMLPVAALALFSLAAPASADVLDFGTASPLSICSSSADGQGSLTACGDWGYLSQSYGDVAGVVDVTYRAPEISDSTSLRWWSTAYNNLYGVLFADGGDGNSTAQVDIVSLQSGQGIALSHFDLGAYPNTSRGTTVTISDLANGHVLYSFSGTVGSGNGVLPTAFDFATPLVSSQGIRIQWMDSAYNVGIDNITYSVTAVPEPETYAMMLAGLALLAGLSRRGRKA